jgi:hypothetical protein
VDAYGLARREYNVLLLYSEGVQYTLTNTFDVMDLVAVAKNIF